MKLLAALINIGWYCAAAAGLALFACLMVASLFIDLTASGVSLDIPASFVSDTRDPARGGSGDR